jgi:hypothetical protein
MAESKNHMHDQGRTRRVQPVQREATETIGLGGRQSPRIPQCHHDGCQARIHRHDMEDHAPARARQTLREFDDIEFESLKGCDVRQAAPDSHKPRPPKMSLKGAPDEPRTQGREKSDTSTIDQIICVTIIPKDKLGSPRADSPNEPSVPGLAGVVGSIVRKVPTLPSIPAPGDRGGSPRSSRGWGLAADARWSSIVSLGAAYGLP